MVAARRSGGREGFAGAAEALGEACALAVRPALELRRALCEGRFELLDVGRHDLRVQSELAGSEEQLLRVEVAAQRVQRLRQKMSRLLLTAFGPEAGEQLVAAHTALTGRCEEGQEGEGSSLRRRSRPRRRIPVDRESP